MGLTQSIVNNTQRSMNCLNDNLSHLIIRKILLFFFIRKILLLTNRTAIYDSLMVFWYFMYCILASHCHVMYLYIIDMKHKHH